ncbi:MAG: DUF86 domain-containing protein [Bacteroidia bacterium]|jgi:uncharacterized protein with HEPN domain|nr:DUF86 domain-containing protein [Bacteroidia bacterium]
MERQIKKFLQDIVNSISSINNFTEQTRTFADYKNNKLVKRAVERELEIIGEAMKRVLELDPEIKINNPKGAVNFRNRISHGYDTIDDYIIWGIITRHLPILKKEVELLLQKK